MQCKIKDRLYVVNLDKCESMGNHGISLYVNHDKVTYFDSFGVEYIPKEIKELIENQNSRTNVFRI